MKASAFVAAQMHDLWHHTKPDMGVAAGNAWDELQTEASAIAAQQRVAELTEWLGCAKIALQVSVCRRQA